MKIAIIGAGAMGSLFGGQLAQEAEVWLYSHNQAYVEAVKKNGLIMTQGDMRKVVPIHVTDDPAEIGPVDVAVLYVKYTGTDKAVQDAMVSAVGPDTLLVSLQNGIGNAEIMKKYVPEAQIAYGFSTQTSDMVAPGHIEMTTIGTVWTYFWPLNNIVTDKHRAFEALLNRCDLPTEVTKEIDDKIWHKLMVNTSQNTLCSILNLNVSDLMETPESFELVKAIIFEVCDVARAKGIHVNREEGLKHVIAVSNSVPGHVPSMYFDVQRRRPTEIGCLNDAVIAEGERLGVATPMLKVAADMIKALEKNYGTLLK